jgi:hypothetical protein
VYVLKNQKNEEKFNILKSSLKFVNKLLFIRYIYSTKIEKIKQIDQKV